MADRAGATPGGVRDTLARLRGDGRGWTLLLVAAGWLFIAGFRVMLPALLPDIKADFDIGNAEAGFALTVLWGIYATLQFPTGIAADRTGERPWLVGGAVLGALSLAGFFLAPFYALFLLASALFGIGSGLFGTPRDLLLTRTYRSADNAAYGVVYAAGSLGAATLPFVGTAIAARTDWRVASVWILPFLFLVGVGLWRVVPARTEPATADLTPAETVRRTVAALSEPRVLFSGTVMLLFVFTFQGTVAFLPTYLVEVKGLARGFAALLFGSLFVVGAAAQPVAGHLADRYGDWSTQVVLIAVSTVLLAGLPVLEGRALWPLVPLLGLVIAIGPLAAASIVRALPEAVQGTGWGLLRTVFFGLGATSSTVIGLLADAGRFDAGFFLLAALVGLAGVVWWRLPRAARG